MTAVDLSAPAEMVRSHDPDLFHAALFAPEPARARLMVLYAFDIELSKAALRPSEPLIARMRLQWWRDLVDGIGAGEPPRAHEVAGPLHGVLSADVVPGEELTALIDAHETELHGAMDEHRFGEWLDARFGGLMRLAAHLLTGGDGAARRAAGAVGHAMGVAYVLRNAVAMAADGGQYLLPSLGPEDRAALARGRTTPHTRAVAHGQADQALALLAAARAGRRSVPPEAAPALLPVWRAERVLAQARKPGFDLMPHPHRPHHDGRRAVSLAWRALRGRW
ncbi:MAG TPA: squalene/phytoene synthase family protein [Thermohalobaculum sp.]|nr:squalene/phytoene synthase family protein [Thermohalobaculum sp.]